MPMRCGCYKVECQSCLRIDLCIIDGVLLKQYTFCRYLRCCCTDVNRLKNAVKIASAFSLVDRTRCCSHPFTPVHRNAFMNSEGTKFSTTSLFPTIPVVGQSCSNTDSCHLSYYSTPALHINTLSPLRLDTMATPSKSDEHGIDTESPNAKRIM